MGHPAEQQEHLVVEWTPQMADVFREVVNHLGDFADTPLAEQFRDDVNRAVLDMVVSGDPKTFNDTLHAWYRTLRVKRSGVKFASEYEDVDAESAMTASEVRNYLGV